MISSLICFLLVCQTSASALCTIGTIPTPTLPQAAYALNAATMIASNDAWIVGEVTSQYASASSTLAEHWNGSTWAVVPTPNLESQFGFFESLNGVGGSATNDVWAVGVSVQFTGPWTSLIEHWDGSTWTIVPSPEPGTYSSLDAVSANSSTDAWAGGFYADSTGTHSLIEHWNGVSWAVVPDVATANVTSISADAPNDVWATGDDLEHWNGASWTETEPWPASSVSAVAPNDVWVLYGGTNFAHWNGNFWKVEASNESGYEAIAASSKNSAWAVGTNNGATITEYWNGVRWTPETAQGSPEGNFVAVGAAASTAIAVGVTTNLTGLEVTWNASSWQNGNIPPVDSASSLIDAISGTEPYSVWFTGRVWNATGFQYPVGAVTMFLDHWNGARWRPVRAASKMGSVSDMSALSPTDVWAVGTGGDPCGGGQAAAMHWNGVEWASSSPDVCAGYESALNSVTVISKDDLWAAGVDIEQGCMICQPPTFDLILRRHDKVWTTYVRAYDGSRGNGFTSIRAVSANDVWAVGPAKSRNGASYDFIWHWNGTRWASRRIQNPEPNGALVAIGVDNAKDIWAVGWQSRDNGQIEPLMYHFDGLTWTLSKHGSAPPGGLTAITVLSSDDVIASGTTYVARWNGRVWTFIPTAEGYTLNTVGGVGSADKAWVAGGHVSPFGNTLWFLNDLHCK